MGGSDLGRVYLGFLNVKNIRGHYKSDGHDFSVKLLVIRHCDKIFDQRTILEDLCQLILKKKFLTRTRGEICLVLETPTVKRVLFFF